ncbi:ABC transporter ATP-binding protein [Haladaptatus pallidirubidus]|uniref:Molybdate/tungstate import ATP-binding protein WtpC n=1 Tax=Haladaptatus pallidirubidus TaxID=1008152 RepID=A0AAV3US74_9EURY|nr:ABC transporter ATP-binding protein [Haladaptatus pallidirubidus]
MIEFERISKEYADGTVAVDDVSFEIPAGETVTIVGPSGCGKTTTMKMINGLINPTEGTIHINGTPLIERDPIEHRRNIGYVIQDIGLFSHLTIRENIGIVPDISGWDGDQIDKRVKELVELVRLPPTVTDNYPDELSGGQQQRVGVARALAANPDVLLMDEPFGALDPITREQLQDEFLDIQRDLDVTIAFVTHDIDEALKMGDHVAVMHDGKLVQFDTPQELLSNPKNKFVEQFIGEDRIFRRLQTISVEEVMETVQTRQFPDEGSMLQLDTSLKSALQLLLSQEQDVIPVVDDGAVVGELCEEDVKTVLDIESFDRTTGASHA